jgi:hypothetical protein
MNPRRLVPGRRSVFLLVVASASQLCACSKESDDPGGGTAGMAGSAGTGGSGSHCTTDCATMGLTCCGAKCVNLRNDVLNCGSCGNVCSGSFPYCDGQKCGTPPCGAGTSCRAGEPCCGSDCCAAGMLCCVVPGGPVGPPMCTPAMGGTCPPGCPTCP